MAKPRVEFEPSTKSLALGIVIGVTITAVVVSIQSFLGYTDFNQQLRYTIDSLKNRVVTENSAEIIQENDFEYPLLEDITAVDTSDWNTYINDEFGFSFSYPDNWEIDTNGTKDCTKAGVRRDCFGVAVFQTDPVEGDSKSILISTSDELKKLQDVGTFSTVMNLSGSEKIFQQYRKSSCFVDHGKKKHCTKDADGYLQFTYTGFTTNGKKLHIYVYGNPDLNLAAILDNFQF
ncbi:MAG: PsbP-related protein [Candidatus Dojkabacteria bacterium]